MTRIQALSRGAPQNDRASQAAALVGTAVAAALVIFVLGSAVFSGVEPAEQPQSVASMEGP